MPEGLPFPFPFLPGGGGSGTPYPGVQALIEELERRRQERAADTNTTPELPRPAVPIPNIDVPIPPELPGDVIDPEAPPPLPVTNAENYPYPIIPGVIASVGPPAPAPPGRLPPPGSRSSLSEARARERSRPLERQGLASVALEGLLRGASRIRPPGRKRKSGEAQARLPSFALGAVVTPRIPRIPLPKPAPEIEPPVGVPRPGRPSGGIADESFRSQAERVRRDTRTRRAASPTKRGPFGPYEEGEIVIVGRRPPRPPVTIGGVGVRVKPRIVIASPLPLPAPKRATAPPRPAPLPVPRPPPIDVPRPPPLEKLPSPPSPSRLPSPLPTPLPAPAGATPVPAPSKARSPRTRTPPRKSPLPAVLGALSTLLRGSTRRSALTLPRSQLVSGTVPGTAVPVPTPLTTTNPSALPSVATAASSGSGNFIPTSTSTCQAQDRARRQRKRDACRRFRTIQVPAHTRRVCEDT